MSRQLVPRRKVIEADKLSRSSLSLVYSNGRKFRTDYMVNKIRISVLVKGHRNITLGNPAGPCLLSTLRFTTNFIPYYRIIFHPAAFRGQSLKIEARPT